jgi:NADH-quinone oxidoreductase subunit J
VTYDIVFIVASVVAIVAALTVVLSGNPFISSLSLIANLIALATFYLLLQSDFLAAAQVIVYAGAVMIMFLFVTAYLGGRADEPTRQRPVWQTLGALVAAAAVAAEIVFGVGRQSFLHGPVVSDAFGSPQAIAGRFLGRYVLAFEGTSILLLIAAVGGVVLATRRPAPHGGDEPGGVEVVRPEPAPSLQSSVMARETQFDVVHTGAGPADDEKEDG